MPLSGLYGVLRPHTPGTRPNSFLVNSDQRRRPGSMRCPGQLLMHGIEAHLHKETPGREEINGPGAIDRETG